MRPFEGKSAVVLGASAPGNCGWEIAKQLAEQGAKVTVAARRTEGLRELAGLIDGLAVRCDTSVEEDVEALAEAAAAAHGPIDVAISAAGVPFVGTIDAIAPDLMRQAFDINFFGPYHFVKHMTRRMRDGGSMVVITSNSASMALPA